MKLGTTEDKRVTLREIYSIKHLFTRVILYFNDRRCCAERYGDRNITKLYVYMKFESAVCELCGHDVICCTRIKGTDFLLVSHCAVKMHITAAFCCPERRQLHTF